VIKVFIIEDHTIVRQGLIALLETCDDMTVVGHAGDGQSALEALEHLEVDIAICDLGLPGLSGLEVIERCATRAHPISCIALSMYHDAVWVQRAIEAGAKGYLVKGSGVSELLHTVRVVASGQPLLSSSAQRALSTHELTPREREVLSLVAQGHTSKEMSALLKISARTIEHHRANLMEKLKIYDVPALTRYAIRQGYIDVNLK
jgi:DNA-binding NarL/FixJ family response regulator